MTTSFSMEPGGTAGPDRSVALEFGAAVDAASVEALRAHIRSIPLAPRQLSLDCGTVRTIDPVGAALLWLLCQELEQSLGTLIRLTHLPTLTVQKLRSHPLHKYVAFGEELFQDPFESPLPSNR